MNDYGIKIYITEIIHIPSYYFLVNEIIYQRIKVDKVSHDLIFYFNISKSEIEDIFFTLKDYLKEETI